MERREDADKVLILGAIVLPSAVCTADNGWLRKEIARTWLSHREVDGGKEGSRYVINADAVNSIKS